MSDAVFAYIVRAGDNVATAITDLPKGSAVELHGDVTGAESVVSADDIKRGFKIALTAIASGEKIMKYGIPIGCATADICQGECVHLHNMRSMRDLRVESYDAATATPKDRSYTLEDTEAEI